VNRGRRSTARMVLPSQTEIDFGGHPVPYLRGDGIRHQIGELLQEKCGDASSLLLVLDRRVVPHGDDVVARMRPAIPVHRYLVDASEPGKRMQGLERLLEWALSTGADRASVVVAMGGGMVGNLAGLAAALLFRGIRLVHLPTTPVAAFDSVLSLKQGINLSGGKNLCGTYLRPSAIACDLTWLATNEPAALRNGVAEMAKNVLSVTPDLIDDFLSAMGRLARDPLPALADLCSIGVTAKAPFLAADPQERGQALVFEYGHTVGHAVEFAADPPLGHGAAVAWGLLAAALVSRDLGALGTTAFRTHVEVVSRVVRTPPNAVLGPIDRPRLWNALANDNKRGYTRSSGHGPEVPMVLLEDLGQPLTGPSGQPLVPVPQHLVESAFEDLASHGTMPA
jgi:3-dehydroquinate synthetase